MKCANIQKQFKLADRSAVPSSRLCSYECHKLNVKETGWWQFLLSAAKFNNKDASFTINWESMDVKNMIIIQVIGQWVGQLMDYTVFFTLPDLWYSKLVKNGSTGMKREARLGQGANLTHTDLYLSEHLRARKGSGAQWTINNMLWCIYSHRPK